jgi:hypothetical protein
MEFGFTPRKIDPRRSSTLLRESSCMEHDQVKIANTTTVKIQYARMAPTPKKTLPKSQASFGDVLWRNAENAQHRYCQDHRHHVLHLRPPHPIPRSKVSRGNLSRQRAIFILDRPHRRDYTPITCRQHSSGQMNCFLRKALITRTRLAGGQKSQLSPWKWFLHNLR